MHEDSHAKLKVHAAWYNEEDDETVSVMKDKTTKFPLEAWKHTQLDLIMSTCVESSWSVAV